MLNGFFKRDLHTGDIIEARNGERGIVVLEKYCIVYQAGGLDELDIFTDDLFVDGLQREGDIFKVYRDPRGPLGFNKLFDLEPIFMRKDDEYTRKRADELNDKYDIAKGRVTAMVFEPCFRRCEETYLCPVDKRSIDMAMSEAPSMTVCGQLKTDRTFIRVPHSNGLFVVYNRHQEKWHMKNIDKEKRYGLCRNPEPIILIPEMNLRIYSRCLLVRMNEHGQLENLRESDYDMVKAYLNQVQ